LKTHKICKGNALLWCSNITPYIGTFSSPGFRCLHLRRWLTFLVTPIYKLFVNTYDAFYLWLFPQYLDNLRIVKIFMFKLDLSKLLSKLPKISCGNSTPIESLPHLAYRVVSIASSTPRNERLKRRPSELAHLLVLFWFGNGGKVPRR